MQHMVVDYVPENYGAGPVTFSQTLEEMYNITEHEIIRKGKFADVFILPHYEVGPVVYGMWEFYFEESKNDGYTLMMKSGIAFHFWNKLSWNRTVALNSTCAYAKIAREFCPRSFWSCDTQF